MAKIVKLTLNNETAYPVSITDAIVNAADDKILSDILATITKHATGWKIVKDESNNAVYYLKNAEDEIKSTIDISEGSLVGTVISDVEYSDITSIFN